MDAARLVRYARRQAGLTQRGLAESAGVPQSTVARIESRQLAPRVTTLERILRATGHTLTLEPVLGLGIDRSQVRELLRLIDDLIRIKRAAGGPKDLIEVEILGALRDEIDRGA